MKNYSFQDKITHRYQNFLYHYIFSPISTDTFGSHYKKIKKNTCGRQYLMQRRGGPIGALIADKSAIGTSIIDTPIGTNKVHMGNFCAMWRDMSATQMSAGTPSRCLSALGLPIAVQIFNFIITTLRFTISY
jgi:hypothetical protein